MMFLFQQEACSHSEPRIALIGAVRTVPHCEAIASLVDGRLV